MRVIITGGAGFIGSAVASVFASRGDEVTVLDDLSAGPRTRHWVPAGVSFAVLDVTWATNLAAVVTGCRPAVICHLAARVSVAASVADPAGDARVNVGGTVAVLEAARQAGARVVLASTAAVYGSNAPVPALESSPARPSSPYGTGKLCAEQYARMYRRLHGTDCAVLRIANVYGPGQDAAGEGGVVAVFCSRITSGRAPVIHGDGRQVRDFIHVKDVAAAFTAAADAALPGIWNISTGTGTSIGRLAALTGAAAGKRVFPEPGPARPGDVRRSILSPSKAARDLGWTAKTQLPQGLKEMCARLPGAGQVSVKEMILPARMGPEPVGADQVLPDGH